MRDVGIVLREFRVGWAPRTYDRIITASRKAGFGDRDLRLTVEVFERLMADPDLLDMASMLIERKAGEFNPNDFHNRYVDALKDLIAEKQKKKGEKVIQDPDADAPPPKGSNVAIWPVTSPLPVNM